jgi:NADPH-ferrihemoprotein reductase
LVCAHLQEVAYGVFGLGNKQYEHFNAVGKRMEKAMNTLGASSVVRRGDGDDDECIDDDFDKWSAELFAALEASSHLVGAASAAGVEAVPEVAPEYEVEILAGEVGRCGLTGVEWGCTACRMRRAVWDATATGQCKGLGCQQ